MNREKKLIFNHKNLEIKGFSTHNYVLKKLETSISVVCSRWDEPFGRTSLEAASRGSAVIISNKGGLPETSQTAIILKNLSSSEIFNQIQKLIDNQKILLKTQKNNLKTFKFITNIFLI